MSGYESVYKLQQASGVYKLIAMAGLIDQYAPPTIEYSMGKFYDAQGSGENQDDKKRAKQPLHCRF